MTLKKYYRLLDSNKKDYIVKEKLNEITEIATSMGISVIERIFEFSDLKGEIISVQIRPQHI